MDAAFTTEREKFSQFPKPENAKQDGEKDKNEDNKEDDAKPADKSKTEKPASADSRQKKKSGLSLFSFGSELRSRDLISNHE